MLHGTIAADAAPHVLQKDPTGASLQDIGPNPLTTAESTGMQFLFTDLVAVCGALRSDMRGGKPKVTLRRDDVTRRMTFALCPQPTTILVVDEALPWVPTALSLKSCDV